MNGIGFRIKLLRKERNLSQKEFAERICVSQSYLSRVELDKEIPTQMLLKLISLEYNCTLEWLEKGNGEMEAISDKSNDYFDREYSEQHRIMALEQCATLLNRIVERKDKPEIFLSLGTIIMLINNSLNIKNSNRSVLIISTFVSYCIEFFHVVEHLEDGKELNRMLSMLDETAKSTTEELKQIYENANDIN